MFVKCAKSVLSFKIWQVLEDVHIIIVSTVFNSMGSIKYKLMKKFYVHKEIVKLKWMLILNYSIDYQKKCRKDLKKISCGVKLFKIQTLSFVPLKNVNKALSKC